MYTNFRCVPIIKFYDYYSILYPLVAMYVWTERNKGFVSCSDFVGYGNSLSNILTFLLSYTELHWLHLNWQSGFWRDFVICFSKHRKWFLSKHCVHWIISLSYSPLQKQNIFSFQVVCFFFFQFVLMLNGKLENCCWVRSCRAGQLPINTVPGQA